MSDGLFAVADRSSGTLKHVPEIQAEVLLDSEVRRRTQIWMNNGTVSNTLDLIWLALKIPETQECENALNTFMIEILRRLDKRAVEEEKRKPTSSKQGFKEKAPSF